MSIDSSGMLHKCNSGKCGECWTCINEPHKHEFVCNCGQRTHCNVCGKKMNRWKSHGTLRHSECWRK